MEALLFIFAEILIACLTPIIAFFGAVIGALVEFFFLLLGWILSLFGHTGGLNKDYIAKRKSSRPTVFRRIIHWGAGILICVGLVGVLASFVLFQPLLRYIMTTAAQTADIHIDYERAEGMLLTGNVTLYGMHLHRTSDRGLGFNLKIRKAHADVDIGSLLSHLPTIKLAQLEGASGYVSPPAPDREKTRKPIRPFRADMVQVSDIDIEIRPKSNPAYSLVIPKAEVAPLGSRTALFDLLFRSNMQAWVAEQPLSVVTRQITTQGRETSWRFENVEVDKLKLLVPRAPLTWLSSGKLNIRVEDQWSLSDEWIDMDWQIGFENVVAGAPDNAGAKERILANGFGKVLTAKNGTANFQYRLALDQQKFKELKQGDINGFWDAVLSGIVKPGILVENQTTKDENKPSLINRFKDLLNEDGDS